MIGRYAQIRKKTDETCSINTQNHPEYSKYIRKFYLMNLLMARRLQKISLHLPQHGVEEAMPLYLRSIAGFI